MTDTGGQDKHEYTQLPGVEGFAHLAENCRLCIKGQQQGKTLAELQGAGVGQKEEQGETPKHSYFFSLKDDTLVFVEGPNPDSGKRLEAVARLANL